MLIEAERASLPSEHGNTFSLIKADGGLISIGLYPGLSMGLLPAFDGSDTTTLACSEDSEMAKGLLDWYRFGDA